MSRDSRATPQQLQELLQFMVENPDFSKGRVVSQQGRIRYNEMWDSLAKHLNALGGGPPKPTAKWAKCWADWRTNVKRKGQRIRAHARGTGGGSPSRPLSDLEENLLQWMTPEAVEGDPSLPQAGFARLPLEIIFDGDMGPSISASGPSISTACYSEAVVSNQEIIIPAEAVGEEASGGDDPGNLSPRNATRGAKRPSSELDALLAVMKKRAVAEERRAAVEEERMAQDKQHQEEMRRQKRQELEMIQEMTNLKRGKVELLEAQLRNKLL